MFSSAFKTHPLKESVLKTANLLAEQSVELEDKHRRLNRGGLEARIKRAWHCGLKIFGNSLQHMTSLKQLLLPPMKWHLDRTEKSLGQKQTRSLLLQWLGSGEQIGHHQESWNSNEAPIHPPQVQRQANGG